MANGSGITSNEANAGGGLNSWLIFSYGGVASGGAIYNLGAFSLVKCALANNAANGGSSGGGVISFPGAGYGGGIFAGIAEIGNAQIEIDRSNRRPDAAAQRNFGGRLGRQL